MRTHRLMVAIVFSAGCFAGAAWTVTHVRASQRSRPAVTQVAVTEEIVPQLEAAVDDTPSPEPAVDWEACQRLDEAAAAMEEARAQLKAMDARIAAARSQAADLEYGLIAARAAEVAAENAVGDGDRRYRQGMLGELEHDRILAERQAAIEQLDKLRSQADLVSRSVAELESDRADALSKFREAREQWRALAPSEAAGPAPQSRPR